MEKPSANSQLTRKVSGPEPRLELLGGERQPLGWYSGLRMDTLNTTSFSSEMEAISYFDRGVFWALSSHT